jgi:hypothetical protein
MSEVEVKVQIDRLEAKVKIVDEKDDGGVVVDRHLITEIKLEYEGTPAKLEELLYTLRAGHAVDVTFASPQLSLGRVDGMVNEPEGLTKTNDRFLISSSFLMGGGPCPRPFLEA